MSCFTNNEEGRISALLSFSREQLLYDIKNYCFIEGSALTGDVSPHNRHMVQDVGEDGNVDRITRILNAGISKCRDMLYCFTKGAVEKRELDDQLKEPPAYGIALSLPEDFSQDTLYYLEKLIHEYLVYISVADWLSITCPGKSDLWAGRAVEAEKEILKIKNRRMSRGNTKRRLRPF